MIKVLATSIALVLSTSTMAFETPAIDSNQILLATISNVSLEPIELVGIQNIKFKPIELAGIPNIRFINQEMA